MTFTPGGKVVLSALAIEGQASKLAGSKPRAAARLVAIADFLRTVATELGVEGAEDDG